MSLFPCRSRRSTLFPYTTLFRSPEIAALAKNFVAVELYTDGTDEASRANQEMEEKRFQTVAIPCYVIVDPDDKVLRSEEHTSELQSRRDIVCRLLLEIKN